MGMSADLEAAIAEGATIVRVGTAIFGSAGLNTENATMRIAFIGAGNMTTSLVGGLVRRGTPAGSLTVSDPVPAQVERLAREFGVHGVADNSEAVREADLVVLAVKPQQMAEVARGIAPALARAPPGRRVDCSGHPPRGPRALAGYRDGDRAHDAQSASADRSRGHGALRRQRRHGS